MLATVCCTASKPPADTLAGADSAVMSMSAASGGTSSVATQVQLGSPSRRSHTVRKHASASALPPLRTVALSVYDCPRSAEDGTVRLLIHKSGSGVCPLYVRRKAWGTGGVRSIQAIVGMPALVTATRGLNARSPGTEMPGSTEPSPSDIHRPSLGTYSMTATQDWSPPPRGHATIGPWTPCASEVSYA